MWIKPLLFSVLFTVFMSAGHTQNLELGVQGGVMYYLGDLNPNRQFLMSNPAYGILGRLNLNDRFAFRVHYLRGEIQGDDTVSGFLLSRGLSFSSKITEIATVMEFNFFDYFTGSKINYFSPYLVLGPCVYLHNPHIGSVEFMVNQPEPDYKASPVDLALILGFGFKYSLTEKLGITAEWVMRKAFSDYLDGVSKKYGNSNFTFGDPTNSHVAGMQRGNSQSNDWYSFAGITLTYRFNLTQKTTCSGFEYSQ